MTPDDGTSYTLLSRAIDLNDQTAWNELHNRYEKFIYYILREINVPDNDLGDLCQQVMVNLMKSLKSYDRSKAKFRTWMKRIIKNIAYMHYRKVYAHNNKIDALTAEQENNQHIIESEFEKLIDEEWENYITTLAMDKIQSTYKGKGIEVFQRTLAGESASKISEDLNIAETTVYTLRQRVKKSLLQEIRHLIQELEGE